MSKLKLAMISVGSCLVGGCLFGCHEISGPGLAAWRFVFDLADLF